MNHHEIVCGPKITRHRRSTACASLLLLALALAAATAQAQPRGDFGGPGQGPPPLDRMLERHADELGLDAAKRDDLRAIVAASREKGRPLADALHAERERLHALLSQDSPDAGAVMKQIDVVGAAETALHKQRLGTLLEVRARLTPEQRKKMVELFEERREGRREDRRERWREGPLDD
jgi:Spy/CpxP family protein refolding chaperone